MGDAYNFNHIASVDPDELSPGVDYAIIKKVPLMPHPDPPGEQAMELLKKMKWLKRMVPFRVGEKSVFKTGTWYRVTRIGVTESPEPYWVNRNALCGSLLLPVGSVKEVSNA
ncbi:MAG: hypothetical protein KAV87_53175 [Desulfobacteraceae bacterium]|nr:hypothetical protein [Desulfobacteraceae bacterium]